MKLNLGGALNPQPSYINVDVVGAVDLTWDLAITPWPIVSNSAEEIRAFEIVEHLPALVPFMDECHRVLQPGGVLHVRTAWPESVNAWRDPTHVRPYYPDSFRYFDPESEWRKWGKLYTDKEWRVESWGTVGKDAFEIVMRPRK